MIQIALGHYFLLIMLSRHYKLKHQEEIYKRLN